MSGSNSIRSLALLVEREASPGTPETIVVGDGVPVFYDLTLTPNLQRIDTANLARIYNGNGTEVAQFDTGASTVTASFTVPVTEVAADGDVPDVLADLFQACGLKETVSAGASVTYAPETKADITTCGSATIHAYRAGTKHVMAGSRGTFKITGNPADGLRANFTMTAGWTNPTPGQAVPGSIPTAKTRVMFGNVTVVTADAAPICLGSFEFDMGGVIDTTVTSCGAAINIVDWKPTVKIDPYADPAVSAWMDIITPSSVVAFSASFNNGAFVLACPKMKLVAVDNGERSGRIVEAGTFECCDTSGDDSFSIVMVKP